MKEDKRFQRMLEKAREYQLSTYVRKFVAPDFQRMIRAEAGAFVGLVMAVFDGELVEIQSRLGECVCVTCSTATPWSGDRGMNCGHFVASRCNSILFEETNVAPQCAHCNKFLGGNQENYSLWMRHVHGQKEIERLRQLRHRSVTFTREELVKRRLAYLDRLRTAESLIATGNR